MRFAGQPASEEVVTLEAPPTLYLSNSMSFRMEILYLDKRCELDSLRYGRKNRIFSRCQELPFFYLTLGRQNLFVLQNKSTFEELYPRTTSTVPIHSSIPSQYSQTLVSNGVCASYHHSWLCQRLEPSVSCSYVFTCWWRKCTRYFALLCRHSDWMRSPAARLEAGSLPRTWHSISSTTMTCWRLVQMSLRLFSRFQILSSNTITEVGVRTNRSSAIRMQGKVFFIIYTHMSRSEISFRSIESCVHINILFLILYQ